MSGSDVISPAQLLVGMDGACNGTAPTAAPRFKGRTVAVVNDLSLQEQWFLYCKTRQLKEAIRRGEDLTTFRLNNPQAAVYTIFLEDSTRTKESFRNAAEFHGMKVNVFDAKTSSFQKNETITDTVKMLCGYSIGHSIFVIRSKVEGVCRWLEESMSKFAQTRGFQQPSFVNAGDGRHEHPTQELLDEFSFLEHKGWDCSSIHLALIGDLMHGRTVHSKVDGLKIYGQVDVDLIAPPELALPEMYTNRMRAAGFNVREFGSIEEYLAQPKVSKIWYFTRLQLERMGEKVRDSAPQLRKAVTFRKEFVEQLPPKTKFFHPLPRDSKNPELPFWLDSMELNGWDQQSQNGYFARIVLLGMLGGVLGASKEDFEGTIASMGAGDAGGPAHLRHAPRAVVPLSPAPSPQPLPDLDVPIDDGFQLPVSKAVESPFARLAADFVQKLPIDCADHAAEASRFAQAGFSLSSSFAGVVVDSIAEGQTSAKVWASMFMVRSVVGLDSVGGLGVYRVGADAAGRDRAAGFITVPHPSIEQQWDRLPLKRLAAMVPGATLTVLQDGRPTHRFKLRMPPRIYNFHDISCKNAACISHPSNAEGEVSAYFLRQEAEPDEQEIGEMNGEASARPSALARSYTFSCKYCDRVHGFWEIWDLKQHQAALM